MKIELLILIAVAVTVVGCATLKPKPWTCPQYENEYDSSNPPDNSVCDYNEDTGVLINAS